MTCRICGNSAGNEPYKIKEMMFATGEEFDYFRCSLCGCLQIKEIPENMERYYPKDYYSKHGKVRKNIENPVIRAIMKLRDRYAFTGRGIAGRMIYAVKPGENFKIFKGINAGINDSILDVGSGEGATLNALSNAGFKNLTGVDPYIAEDAVLSNGVTLYKKRVEEVKGKWDIVVFNHSFEHLADPESALAAADELLTQNGVCIIRIPVCGGFAWEHYKTDWVQIDAPRHFFIHTEQSLKITADKAGLEIFRSDYDSYELQFWGSEQYKKGISMHAENSYFKNPKKSIFTPADMEEFRKRSDELNAGRIGDQAAFFLRKK
jgi:SAM-dependent methyltransferase